MGTFTSDILDELSYCFTQELHTKYLSLIIQKISAGDPLTDCFLFLESNCFTFIVT